MAVPTKTRATATVALAIATVVLLVGGLVAFVVTRDDGDEQRLAGDDSASTSTSTAEAGAGAGGEDGAATATAPDVGGEANTAAPGPAGGAAAEGPSPTVAGPAQPAERGSAPKQGTYEYRRTRSGQAPEEIDRIVRDISRTATEVHQQVESEDANGGRIRNDVIWRGEGLVVTRSTFSGPQGDVECDWEPDMLEYPAPLAKGKRWTIESSCTSTAQGQTVRVERKATREVTGAEKLSVGGEAVDTWVVTGTDQVTITVGPPAAPVFQQVVDSSGTVHISPAHGAEVRSVVNVKSGDSSESITGELLSLQPK